MPLRLTRRRTLAKLGLFLLAGAMVNVGVAWGAILIEQGIGGPGRGAHVLAPPDGWPFPVPDDWPAPTRAFGSWNLSQSSLQIDNGPELGEAKRGRTVYALQLTAGLPFRSLVARTWIDDASVEVRTSGGIRLPDDQLGGSVTLPWRPTPLGFTLNTAVYAALLYAPFILIALRRSRRLSRGLCPRCKYALADLPTCPECGETIRRKAAEA